MKPWIVFLIIFAVILLGSIGYYFVSGTLAKKRTKNSRAMTSIGIALYSLVWDCLLLCYLHGQIIWQFVVGFVLLFISGATLAHNLSNGKKIKRIGFPPAIDSIIIVILTIHLLCLIPDKDLQAIMVPVVAAVLGGLLTLIGVAWTIRNAEKNRMEDETKKAKPMFTFNMLYEETLLDNGKKVCFDASPNPGNYTFEVFVEIENSLLSSFTFRYLYHDKVKTVLEGNTVLLPGNKCILVFRFSDSEKPIYLQVEDSLGNSHIYVLKTLVSPLGKITTSGLVLSTLCSIVLSENITESELDADYPLVEGGDLSVKDYWSKNDSKHQ